MERKNDVNRKNYFFGGKFSFIGMIGMRKKEHTTATAMSFFLTMIAKTLAWWHFQSNNNTRIYLFTHASSANYNLCLQ